MRSFTITALIGTGLLGLAPQAQAASHARPAHPQPARPGAPKTAHARPADPQPQPDRPGIQSAVHAQAQADRPAGQSLGQNAVHAHPADPQPDRPNTRVIHAQPAEPQPGRPGVQSLGQNAVHAHPADPQPGRPGVQNAVHVRPADPPPQPQPVRPSYALHMTGQAAHWEVSPGELETVRWTLTNTGNRPLDHVQLVASIPAGWTVREGQGCARRGDYLGCDLGGLEPGRSAAVLVPMVVGGQPGPVRLAAWSRATAGSLSIPGPTTSFRVVVTGRR